MKRFLVSTISALLLLKATEGVLAGHDWEYWSKYSLEIACGEKIGFGLEPQFKFKNNFKVYYYSKAYVGLSYRLNKSLKIKGYYAYKTKKSKTGWNATDLLYLDPTLKFVLRGVDLSNRFRLEYDLDKKELVYRNRLKLGKSLYGSLTPFIQEEPFYSFSFGQLEENRFSLGLSARVSEHTGLSGEYMLNGRKVDSGWRDAFVLVTKLSFLF